MASNGYISKVLVLVMVLVVVMVPTSVQGILGTEGKCPLITRIHDVSGTTIIWPATKAGEIATVDCPRSGLKGAKATKLCKSDGQWETTDDFSKCQIAQNALDRLDSLKVTKDNVTEAARELNKIFKDTPPNSKSKDHLITAVELLQQIVSFKEKLNETGGDIVETVDAIMKVNGTTLAATGNATTRATQVLDDLAANIVLAHAKKKELSSTNLLVQAVDIAKNNFQGLSFDVSAQRSESKNINVKLPASILDKATQGSVRVGFIYFANNKLFQEKRKDEEKTTSQIVLSSSIYGVNTTKLADAVKLRFPRPKKTSVNDQSCVFWNEEARQWSNAGCFLCPKQTSNDSVECCCNHLTSFAVLFSPEKDRPTDDVHQKILSMISFVGCIISLICVILTFLTYLLFKHLRKTNQQPILMNLCIAIALLLIVFLSGINSTGDRLGCQIVAVLLHYLTLVTVLWMGIEAYNLYLQIVKVMAIYQRKFMLKAALVGWGAPLVIVVVTVIAAAIEGKDGTPYYGSDYACVLHKQLYRVVAWFVPMLGILLFNLCIFICVMYNLRKTLVQADAKSNYKKQCWTALAIMCLLGLTWLFGALAISDARIAFEYLFCIFNSLQGFFIFFFHCVRIKEVRSQWSLFVSGLGFSHRDSQGTHSHSKSNEGQRKAVNSRYSKMKNWIVRSHSDPTRQTKKDNKVESGVAKEVSEC